MIEVPVRIWGGSLRSRVCPGRAGAGAKSLRRPGRERTQLEEIVVTGTRVPRAEAPPVFGVDRNVRTDNNTFPGLYDALARRYFADVRFRLWQ